MKQSALSTLVVAAACIVMQVVSNVELQAQDNADSSGTYLVEQREPPPAKEVRRRKVEQKYSDETPRLRYEVVQLSDDTFVNDGRYIEYYRDGQIFQQGTFKDGGYEGEWTYWHPNGQVCKKITYKSSLPQGSWEVFRKDGTKSEIQAYDEGKRDGQWIFFYPNGEDVMLELNYDAGRLEGKRISYYKNGQKKQEIDLKAGKMDGTFTEWDEAGKKRLERKFKEGRPDGDPIYY